MGRLSIPDDATDEQIDVKVRQIKDEHNRAQIAARTARQKAQAGPGSFMDDLTGLAMAPIRGAAQVPGRAVEMGKGLYGAAKGVVTGEAFGPPAPRDVSPEEQAWLEANYGPESMGGTGDMPLLNPYDPLTKGILRAAAPTIGGAVGSMAGPVGTGVGVMGGEAINQLVERSMAALQGLPVESATKMIEDLFGTGILGGLTEAIPRAVIKGAGAPSRAFQKTIHAPGREAMKALPFEARPSLAQISSSRGVGITENVAEASLFGGGRVTRGKAGAGTGAEKLVRGVPESLPPKGSAEINRLSDQIDALGADVPVDFSRTVAEAKRLLAKERPLGEFGKDDKFTSMIKQVTDLEKEVELIPGVAATKGPAGYTAQVGGTAAQPAVTTPRTVSFVTAKNIRGQLNELARSPVGVLASQSERGAIRRVASLFKKDMLESAAEGGHQTLVRNYQDYNRIARQASTREKFEELIREATSTKKDITTPVIQGGVLRSKLFHAKKEFRGTLDAEALQRFEKFSRVLQTAQSRSADGTGRMMIQLTQGTAALGLATGGLTGPSAAVLGIPYVMSRALASPRFYRYMTEGFQHVGTPRGTAAITTLLREMQDEDTAEEKLARREKVGKTPYIGDYLKP
jgi:hypothetical protein